MAKEQATDFWPFSIHPLIRSKCSYASVFMTQEWWMKSWKFDKQNQMTSAALMRGRTSLAVLNAPHVACAPRPTSSRQHGRAFAYPAGQPWPEAWREAQC